MLTLFLPGDNVRHKITFGRSDMSVRTINIKPDEVLNIRFKGGDILRVCLNPNAEDDIFIEFMNSAEYSSWHGDSQEKTRIIDRLSIA